LVLCVKQVGPENVQKISLEAANPKAKL